MKYLLPFLLIFISYSSNAQFSFPIKISGESTIFEKATHTEPVDFDQDGDIDIIAGTIWENTIAIYENKDGQGSFADPYIIAEYPGFGLRNIGIVDADEDGDLDIFVLSSDGKVYIYENNGRPGLWPLILQFEEDVSLFDLVMVDLNQDGLLDAICTSPGTTIGWYKNESDGLFADYQILTEEGGRQLEVADFNGDGEMDIMSGSYVNSSINLFLNDGEENFTEEIMVSSEEDVPDTYSSADFDGDGDLDFVGTNDFANYVKYYENTGNGMSWAESVDMFTEPTSAESALAADIDDDGDIDFVCGTSGKLSIFENMNGAGLSETPYYTQNIYGSPENLYVFDMNGDNITDILIAAAGHQQYRGQIGILQRRADNTYYNLVDICADADQILYLGAFDLDDDGVKELVVDSKGGYSRAAWHTFDNTPYKLNNFSIFPTGIGNIIDCDNRDVDADGEKDMIISLGVPPFYSAEKIIWLKKKAGVLIYEDALTIHEITSGEILDMYTEDFDADGDIDIVFSTNYNASSDEEGVFLMTNNGAGVFSDPILLGPETTWFNSIFVNDIDGDGDFDIICANSNLHWIENTGNGNFAEIELILEFGLSYTRLYIEDMDGDSLDDIIITSFSGEFGVSYYKNESNVTFSSAIEIASGSGDGIIIIDADNDKDLDVLSKESFNDPYVLYLNIEENNTFEPSIIVGGLEDYRLLHVATDIDNDGDVDLFTASDVSSRQSVYYHESFVDLANVVGEVFYDVNENGIQDGNDTPFVQQGITINPTEIVSFTSSNGRFIFATDEGDYDVNCQPENNYALTTPGTISVSTTALEVVEVAFGVSAENEIVEGDVNLVSAATRCGFEIPFWLHYQNTGTVPTNGTVQLPLDPLVSFVSSEPTPDSIVNDIIYWSFTDLFPTTSGQISMILQMPPVEFIGESITMNPTLDLEQIGGDLRYSVRDEYTSIINCSFDPNDKLVEPSYPGYDNFTFIEDTLKYTVRFQNTGTDTAFTVRIEDYIDADVDIETLKFTGSSHPYTAEFNANNRRLLFTFSDILLPDSTTNLVGSQGFISYEIRIKEQTSIGTFIPNTASIYFDFNPPVITNTVYSLLVDEVPLVFEVSNPSCFGGSDGEIDLLFEAPYYTGFLWSNAEETADNRELSVGTYSLTINNATGTDIDTSFTLSQPNEIITEAIIQDLICASDEDGSIQSTTEGGTGEYTYQWSNNTLGATINNLSGGSYSVTISDENNCITTADYTVNAPSLLSAETEITQTIACYGETGEITASANGGTGEEYSYLWSNGIETASVQNVSASTYSITVTDEAECTTTVEDIILSQPDVIVVTVNTEPEMGDSQNGRIMVEPAGGVAPYSYAWSPLIDANDGVAENLEAGDYSVTISDANGCTQILNITVDNLSSVFDSNAENSFTVFPNPSSGAVTVLLTELIWDDVQLKVQDVSGRNLISDYSPDFTENVQELNLPAGIYYFSLTFGNQTKTQRVVILKN